MAGNRAGALKGWITRRERELEKLIQFEKRSAASQKGWATRREREREKADEWKFTASAKGEWIVEEPIDTVGGTKYKKSGIFLR